MATPFQDVTSTSRNHDVTWSTLRPEGWSVAGAGTEGWSAAEPRSPCLLVNSSQVLGRDHSQDVVSGETMVLFNALKGSVLLPGLALLGVPANLLNLLVFARHGLRQRINLCLFALSLVDLLFLVFVFFMYVEQLLAGPLAGSAEVDTEGVNLAIIRHNLLGCYGLGWASQFVSALIATERCLCVLWPLRSATLLQTRTVGAVLAVGVALITGGRFAVTAKFSALCLQDAVTSARRHVLAVSRYYRQHQRLVDGLDGTLYGLLIPIGSCTTVAVAAAITALMLSRSRRFRQSAAGASSLSAKEAALTRMLVYLSLQFVVFNLPNSLFRISLLFLPQLSTTGPWVNLYFVLVGVAELCAAFNASLNVLVYYSTGSKYRATLHALLLLLPRRAGCVAGAKATRGSAADSKTDVSTVNTVN